jgi:Ubiquitin-like domain
MLLMAEKKSEERFRSTEQRQHEIGTEQKNILLGMRDALENQVILIKHCINGMSEQMRTSWLSQLASIFTVSSETYRKVSEIQDSLPSHLERTLFKEPFILEDALGRIFPLSLEFVDSWEFLDFAILGKFRDQEGYRKVLMKEFVLQDRMTKRDISRAEPWSRAILPGQRVDMSITFTNTHNPSQMYCPSCLHVCELFLKAGTKWYVSFWIVTSIFVY